MGAREPPRPADPVRSGQDDFYALHGAYPLRGRPFGIAFVWSNVYQDSSGANALQIAEDSALRFAEMLQCMGYEVRPRKNVRRKYIMDDLSDENLAVLRDVYDTVLVYVAGCGDGKSFLSQYNETITIEEVWERFDAAGVVGKPRVLVMDLFQIRSTLMDNFMEDLKATQRSVEDFQREMDALELQGLEHPPSMLQRMKQLRDELEFKRARKKELRHPPAAGLPARMAIMGVPLAAGVVTWKIKIVRLAYQITLGVCNPDPLQKWHGIGVERYTVSARAHVERACTVRAGLSLHGCACMQGISRVRDVGVGAGAARLLRQRRAWLGL